MRFLNINDLYTTFYREAREDVLQSGGLFDEIEGFEPPENSELKRIVACIVEQAFQENTEQVRAIINVKEVQ